MITDSQVSKKIPMVEHQLTMTATMAEKTTRLGRLPVKLRCNSQPELSVLHVLLALTEILQFTIRGETGVSLDCQEDERHTHVYCPRALRPLFGTQNRCSSWHLSLLLSLS
jgi:hypothetical protein